MKSGKFRFHRSHVLVDRKSFKACTVGTKHLPLKVVFNLVYAVKTNSISASCWGLGVFDVDAILCGLSL